MHLYLKYTMGKYKTHHLIIKILIHVFLGLLLPIILSCFMGYEIIIYYILLIILITILGKLMHVLFENPCIIFASSIIILVMAGSLRMLNINNYHITIKFIEELGKSTANALKFLVNNPDFSCNKLCNFFIEYLIENIAYLEFIIFHVIVLLPLFTVYKISRKIINLLKNNVKIE